jgi:hypothetical protein
MLKEKPKKITFKWSCGCIPDCEHNTRLGAAFHIWLFNLLIWLARFEK